MPAPAWLIPAAISLGSAYLSSRGKKNQTTTQTADPRAWTAWNQLWGQAGGGSLVDPGKRRAMLSLLESRNPAARLAAHIWLQNNPEGAPGGELGGGLPIDPNFQHAMDQFREYGNLGMGGARALGGDTAAIRSMMNPYESEVMASLDPAYARAREGALSSIASQATRAGAFGGSRAAIMQGQALGDLAQQQAQTQAGMRYQGFNDAMSRAYQLANLGMGASQSSAGYGQYLQDRGFNRMRDAMSLIPGGATSGVPINRDPLQTGLGTFTTLWGMKGMPWSTMAGAG